MKRRGYSLIEMLVVIAVLGTILTMVAVVLHGLQRAHSRVRDDLSQNQTLDRLISQLRRDAHGAVAAAVAVDDGGSQELRLTAAHSATIRFASSDLGLERTVANEQGASHRDTFVLRQLQEVRWSVVTTGGVDLARLTFVLGTGTAARSHQVQAAIGPHQLVQPGPAVTPEDSPTPEPAAP